MYTQHTKRKSNLESSELTSVYVRSSYPASLHHQGLFPQLAESGAVSGWVTEAWGMPGGYVVVAFFHFELLTV